MLCTPNKAAQGVFAAHVNDEAERALHALAAHSIMADQFERCGAPSNAPVVQDLSPEHWPSAALLLNFALLLDTPELLTLLLRRLDDIVNAIDDGSKVRRPSPLRTGGIHPSRRLRAQPPPIARAGPPRVLG